MNKHVNHVVRRLIIYFFICLLAGVGITGLTSSFETRFNSTSSILFPLLTIFIARPGAAAPVVFTPACCKPWQNLP